MDTFQKIIDEKRLMYEYIRGSHLYGLQNEDSDIDTSALFIASKKRFLLFSKEGGIFSSKLNGSK